MIIGINNDHSSRDQLKKPTDAQRTRPEKNNYM